MRRSRDTTVTRLPRRPRSYSAVKLLTAVGVLCLGFLLLVIVVQAFQRQQILDELKQYQEQIEASQGRNQQLEEEIERLQDRSYLKYLARKYLGLVKPGETVYQLQD
ncbi:MAG TPA: septum formation initiator family protein [Bacillota bacterium]|nr:septum formation initiator family protein [Bacillota bacterium]HPZ65735.1 septum formation initiator family protein [Bacillota bacterium]HQD05534.1 septum formation initiator family protein [Bacillota bacterium]